VYAHDLRFVTRFLCGQAARGTELNHDGLFFFNRRRLPDYASRQLAESPSEESTSSSSVCAITSFISSGRLSNAVN
jgi:hypothetical protein